jgi:hypothetical protein
MFNRYAQPSTAEQGFSPVNFVEPARKMATALIETADESRAVAMI